jgi:transmembrane sensor
MTNHPDRIIQLIIRHLNNELDEDGWAELRQWMNESEMNRQAVEDFLTDDSLKKAVGNLYQLRARIWQRLDRQMSDDQSAAPPPGDPFAVTHAQPAVPKRPARRRYAAAAVVLILLGAAGYLALYRQPSVATGSKTIVATGKDTSRHDVLPGGNKAVLIVAGGPAIILDSARTGFLTSLGHTKVVKVNNGELAYHAAAGRDTLSEGLNMLRTPRGGQYRLVLPDGTRVWLNAASSIQFPTVFNGNERKVTITGEVYFEVAKNASQPFIVEIDNRMQVQVLGTSFNVNAYTDEASVNTTLLEGAVRVTGAGRTTLLKPDQQSRIYNDGRSEVKRQVDTRAVVAWKNGNFQFDSDDIRSIMRQISRWYDVEVVYSGEVPGSTYSGEVSRNTNLVNVLKILSLSGVRFTVNNDRVTVMQ